MRIKSIFKRPKSPISVEVDLYRHILKQSRSVDFYGPEAVNDSFEGRLDMLTLHMTPFMRRLKDYGADGDLFKQAMFDAMVDDFDTALREEGFTDSGVKRRIKPFIALFYERLKLYDIAIDQNDRGKGLQAIFESTEWCQGDDDFNFNLSQYLIDLYNELSNYELAEIAVRAFDFPDLNNINHA